MILTRDGWLLFLTRFLRLFSYGMLAVVLVFYLTGLGLSESQTGLLLTLTLAGDTAVSLMLTTQADRIGRRTEKKRTNMKVATNAWHTLRVDFEGNHFTVTFDGKKAIELDDTTFKDAGQVGVWTKADSVTLFDDFSYGPK